MSLYARIKGICNKEAYLELAHESKVYPLPQPPSPQTQERQPCSLEQRHAVYTVFEVVSLELKSQTENEISFSVCVSKGGIVQEPDRTIFLEFVNGHWGVVNEGY